MTERPHGPMTRSPRRRGAAAPRRESQKVLLLALALDALLGEPPAPLHPVVWMGRLLAALEAHAPRGAEDRCGGGARGADGRGVSSGPSTRLAYGAVAALGGALAWGALGWTIERLAPWPLRAVALKPTFAGRALLDAARRVEDSLRAGRLDRARRELRSLVSRPTTDLDAGLVAAAAIESLAENLVDSWVAPLAAYAGGGLAGAYAYRAANTADAMWGYRVPTYEQLGKAAARLDDGLNWVPARIGALLLLGAGPRRREAFAVWRRDARLTDSPNAGRPMAVAAGQLGVRLEKRGQYALHAAAPPPAPHALAAARRLVRRAMLLAALIALAACGLRDRAGGRVVRADTGAPPRTVPAVARR
jgi:adenosylcobinamide-phosphate synthase